MERYLTNRYKSGFDLGQTRGMAQRQLEERCESHEKEIGGFKENPGKHTKQMAETQKALAILMSEATSKGKKENESPVSSSSKGHTGEVNGSRGSFGEGH